MEYIKKQKKKGFGKEEIKKKLIEAGHKEETIGGPSGTLTEERLWFQL